MTYVPQLKRRVRWLGSGGPEHRVNVAGVPVVLWNPYEPGTRRRRNNFGDVLGPALVKMMHRKLGLKRATTYSLDTLVTIGSIMHFARGSDVVWGAGVNGHVINHEYPQTLDIRSVRGPLTRNVLQSHGCNVPTRYGDPGLLFSREYSTVHGPQRRTRVVVIPHMNDYAALVGVPLPPGVDLVDPCSSADHIMVAVSRAQRVVASSLHGIVIAEGLGVPAVWMKATTEPPFKYHDYLLGTSRSVTEPADGLSEALDAAALPAFDVADMCRTIEACFPRHLWRFS